MQPMCSPNVGPLGPGSCSSESLPRAHVTERLGGLAWVGAGMDRRFVRVSPKDEAGQPGAMRPGRD